eukprot:CAMPEP_0185332740 /NCGR_PEP_ID=MMETSP1363-20130426/81960_1 /TAXON_ID=38817 /ORGANISM="Gephyrocapsa oceanica, Strain RCC1303" /LENGTH=44 /DNA_ID= /DNA_START= /DNA_END= /DNA_ORIENTATION=
MSSRGGDWAPELARRREPCAVAAPAAPAALRPAAGSAAAAAALP